MFGRIFYADKVKYRIELLFLQRLLNNDQYKKVKAFQPDASTEHSFNLNWSEKVKNRVV